MRQVQAAGGAVGITPQIMSEVGETLRHDIRLRRWLRVSDEQVERFLKLLADQCLQLRGIRQLHVVVKEDPDDDKILAAAAEAGARHIVTEDRHLLALSKWNGIQIVTRSEFEIHLNRREAA